MMRYKRTNIPFVAEGPGFAIEDCGMQCKAQNVDGSLTPSRLCNAAMRPQDRSQDRIFRYDGYIPFVAEGTKGIDISLLLGALVAIVQEFPLFASHRQVKHKVRQRYYWVLAWLMAALFHAPAWSGVLEEVGGLSAQDMLILSARDAVRIGNRETLHEIIPQLQQHPLGIYPEYWLLHLKLADNRQPVSEEEIQAFFKRNPSQYITDKLRAEWILYLGRRSEYARVLAESHNMTLSEDKADRQLNCTVLLARQQFKLDIDEAQALAAIRMPVAVTSASRENPDMCASLYEQLQKQGAIKTEDIRTLIQDLIEENQLITARRIASYMFSDAELRQFDILLDKPMAWLSKTAAAKPTLDNTKDSTKASRTGAALSKTKPSKKPIHESTSRDLCTTVASGPKTRSTESVDKKYRNRSLLGVNEDSEYRATPYLGRAVGCAEVSSTASSVPANNFSSTQLDFITLALGRLPRDDLIAGYSYFQRVWAARLPLAQSRWVQSQFALGAARKLMPQARIWYDQAAGARLSEEGYAWYARTLLRTNPLDWEALAKLIEQMPLEQRTDVSWSYWYARALQAMGQSKQAQALFQRLANTPPGQFGFYGKLAAEELGFKIALPPRSLLLTAEEKAAAENNPSLIRALKLFQLGMRSDASREWSYGIQNASDRQLLAAADLALRNQILDRAISTADRTRNDHDFSLRFLMPFRQTLAAKAQTAQVDEAWVYGLIRQESRFMSQARSQVGAAGLMQLMPTTASWVAKKLGLQEFTNSQINDLDTNLTLGTGYLKMMLDQLDGSAVLASAAYNAGPGRPRSWRATLEHPVEGAIFAETIPFTETRDYVKKVLSNATWYAALISGQPQSLKQRLGVITPK